MSDHILAPVDNVAVDVQHVVSLRRGMPPHAECTCGWKTDPSKEIFELGVKAFDHSSETGHLLRHHEAASQ